MNLGLEGKTVFISGSGEGIGKAIAICMAQEGANVIINDINENRVKITVDELKKYGTKVLGLCFDVSNEKEVKENFGIIKDEFGCLDILINNAGINKDKPIIELDLEEWRKNFAVNVESIFICTKEAVKIMKRERKPVIINAGSFASKMPAMGYGCYAATKAAVASLTKSLCGELSNFGIRVAGYIPGVTNTGINKELFEREPSRLCEQIPLNKIAEPIEIGKVATFIASEAGDYIAGVMVEADGGKLCVQNPRRYDKALK